MLCFSGCRIRPAGYRRKQARDNALLIVATLPVDMPLNLSTNEYFLNILCKTLRPVLMPYNLFLPADQLFILITRIRMRMLFRLLFTTDQAQSFPRRELRLFTVCKVMTTGITFRRVHMRLDLRKRTDQHTVTITVIVMTMDHCHITPRIRTCQHLNSLLIITRLCMYVSLLIRTH